ncbi:MAG: hypothetical protein ACOC0M_00330 [Halomonas sp.]
MPILEGDIKLMQSQRMSDNSDGGGRITGNEVVDGESNGIFDDVDDLDRTTGNVGLRKVFPTVHTDDTDTYMGTNVIVAEPPSDPNVDVTLFTTKNHDDERDAARNTMERYLAPGPRLNGYLLDTQLEGQRAIRILQRTSDPLPEVGQVLYLVQDEGTGSEHSQYVRVAAVQAEARDFNIENWQNTFTRSVVTVEITDPLRHQFDGGSPSPYDNVKPPATVRETVVADAATYYSTRPTTEPAPFGNTQVKADSIFTQLVPSARSETALVNLTAAGESQALVDSGKGQVEYTTQFETGPNRTFYLGTGVKPGTLEIVDGSAQWTDKGGQVRLNGNNVGTIDYGRGLVVFAPDAPQYSGSKTVRFHPAAAPVRVADTAATYVSPNTRGYTYIQRLRPTPTPGTTRVSYMAQGKWYDLRDGGDGVLRGSEQAYGSGSVDFVTGDVVVTLGALPDAESEVVYSWATPVSYFNRSDRDVTPARYEFQLAEEGIAPTTLTITWDGGDKTATDDGQGNLTGDATGTIRYASGRLTVQPNEVPLGGSEFDIDYSWGDPSEEAFTAPIRNGDGTITLTLAGSNLAPNTVELEWNLDIEDYTAISDNPDKWMLDASFVHLDPYKIVRDDGQGNLIDPDGDEVIGTVDYAAGEVTFDPETEVSIPVARYSVNSLGQARDPNGGTTELWRTTFTEWDYKPAGAFMPYDESGKAWVRYRSDNEPNAAFETATAEALTFDLTDGFAEAIQSGSVRFRYGNKTYVDRSGTIVTDIDPQTGAAQSVGSIDYSGGTVTLTEYVPGQPNTVELQSLLTQITGQVVDEATWRTPGAPLRPGSLYIQANAVDGTTIEVTANSDGTISGDGVEGRVDYGTGIVRVRFGEWLDATTVEDEPWFEPSAVQNGQIWYSTMAYADTIAYNAVVYRYLSLDPEIIGIDPIRLPSDGRVPVYRPGNIVVVHHTDETPFPIGITDGETLDVERTRLAHLRIEDGNGQDVPDTAYSADLDAGTVTLTGTPDTDTHPEPWRAIHRVEDMALVSDVDISGRLTLTKALSHEYPAGSYVSTALVMNDLQARVTNLFDQSTWNGTWSDERQGDEPTSEYNDTTYPITVTNRGALQQRWALIFTSTSGFRIVGETVGEIGQGTIHEETAPLNPNTNVPYFRIPAGGWGTGWSAGNVVRFNTIGAAFPVWIVRTVLQSEAVGDSDVFRLQVRGNVNA